MLLCFYFPQWPTDLSSAFVIEITKRFLPLDLEGPWFNSGPGVHLCANSDRSRNLSDAAVLTHTVRHTGQMGAHGKQITPNRFSVNNDSLLPYYFRR